MNPRNKAEANAYGTRARRSRRRGLWLFLTVVVVACLVVFVYEQRPVQAPSTDSGIESLPVKKPIPQIVEFRMTDFEHGWMRYSDGVTKVTSDGGAGWQEAPIDQAGQALPVGSTDANGNAGGQAARGEWSLAPTEERKPETIIYNANPFPVKQSQFLTDRIGWALLADGSGLPLPLLVTADGGETWRNEVTPDVQAVVQAEKKREGQMPQEAAMFGSPEQAKLAMRANWAIIPENASPGTLC